MFQMMAEEQPVTLPEAIHVSTVDLGADKKRKRKGPKPEASKKRKNLTMDLSQGTVRFDEIVLVKVGQKQKMVLLKGYSRPNSAFYKKRRQQKLNMKLKHLNQIMTLR